MLFRRLTWRELLLACTAIILLAPAAMAGGVRDPVPTRTAPPPVPAVETFDYPGHTLVIPGQLFVNCYGVTSGPAIVFSTSPSRYTLLSGFAPEGVSESFTTNPTLASRRR